MADLVHRDDLVEVWCGNSLDAADVAMVMGKRAADLLCVDAPYSEKTHSGHRDGKLTADGAAAWARSAGKNTPNTKNEKAYAARKSAAGESGRNDLNYSAWSPGEVDTFCTLWVPRTAGWCVSITDDVLAQHWGGALEAEGLYRFAPLPLVETGSRVRMTGDGPSSWTCWVVVGRPKSREFASWGTLRGAYIQAAERDFNSSGGSDRIVGGKPMRSMRAIVRDYSRPAQLVVDPCAGGGVTLLAAKFEGRRAIGIEKDHSRAELCARLVRDTRHQRDLFERFGT